jgi:hypothetical protein
LAASRPLVAASASRTITAVQILTVRPSMLALLTRTSSPPSASIALAARRRGGVVGHVGLDEPCAQPFRGLAAALGVSGPDVDGVARG